MKVEPTRLYVSAEFHALLNSPVPFLLGSLKDLIL